MRALASAAAAFLLAAAAAAQQRPIFDTDDFINPAQHQRPVFISRIVLAAVRDAVDNYRPLRQDVAALHFVNALYAGSWQFAYGHTEMRGEHEPPPVFRCGCSPPIYFPTPPGPNAAPAAPPPGSRDTLQAAWYRLTEPNDALRYRVTISSETFRTSIHSASSGEVIDRVSGRERSIGFDADTRVSVRDHDFRGSLLYVRTVQRGLTGRTQQELAYTARPPAWAVGPVLMRSTLTVGNVSNRGGRLLNVINPAVEAFWYSHAAGVNLNVIWSPQTTRDGASGWRTRSQVALLAERALWVHLFH